MKNIIFFSSNNYDKKYFNKANKKFNFKLKFEKKQLNLKTVNLAKNYNHICIFVNDNANDPKIIKSLKNLNIKTIALRCTGFNNVDLNLTKKNNIKVINVKKYSPQSIAEFTVGLILNLNRKIHLSYQYTKNKNFSLENLIGNNIYNKTIGIIGTGQIGYKVIKILKGFDANIIAYDLIESEKIKNLGIKYYNLEEIYKKSDIISLHCPYNKDTHNMINKKSLKLFKKNSMLINTSRGELINTNDIIEAIKNENIGSLGIDVYENEKEFFFKNKFNNIIKDDNLNLLLSYNNVIITGHQAFLTKESLIKISNITLNNISKIILNKKCLDFLNI